MAMGAAPTAMPMNQMNPMGFMAMGGPGGVGGMVGPLAAPMGATEEWPGQWKGRPRPPSPKARTTGRGNRRNNAQVVREEKEIVKQKEKVRELTEEKQNWENEKKELTERLAKVSADALGKHNRCLELIKECTSGKTERNELRAMYDAAMVSNQQLVQKNQEKDKLLQKLQPEMAKLKEELRLYAKKYEDHKQVLQESVVLALHRQDTNYNYQRKLQD